MYILIFYQYSNKAHIQCVCSMHSSVYTFHFTFRLRHVHGVDEIFIHSMRMTLAEKEAAHEKSVKFQQLVIDIHPLQIHFNNNNTNLHDTQSCVLGI